MSSEPSKTAQHALLRGRPSQPRQDSRVLVRCEEAQRCKDGEVESMTPRTQEQYVSDIERELTLANQQLAQMRVPAIARDAITGDWRCYCETCCAARALVSTREQLSSLRVENERLKEEREEDERMDEQTIKERDDAEDAITSAAVQLGCGEEWSNVHSHFDCVPERIAMLQQRANAAERQVVASQRYAEALESELRVIGKQRAIDAARAMTDKEGK